MKLLTLFFILNSYQIALGQNKCSDFLQESDKFKVVSNRDIADKNIILSNFVEELFVKGTIINQTSNGLNLADGACGPVCAVNMVQTALVLNGKDPIKDPIAEANNLSNLRVFAPEQGSTFEELQTMIQNITKKYLSWQIKIKAAYFDRGGVLGDLSIPRIPEITLAQLSSFSPENSFNHFDIIKFAPMTPDGLSPYGHAILAIGVDQATGHLIVMDPKIGRSALVSLHEEVVMGRKTLYIQYESSPNNDPYWKTYSVYGKIVITGLISIQLLN